MSKTIKIILGIATIVIVVILLAVFMSLEETQIASNVDLNNIESAEALENLINEVYKDVDEELPSLETTAIDVSEKDTVAMLTGLENGDDLKYLVISQPLMSSQAYSFVLAKVKDGVDASGIAKKMSEKVDMRRWICVEAEKLYATNSGDIVCLIMADADKAKEVYNSFKAKVGTVGEEYEREAEEIELPPDMY